MTDDPSGMPALPPMPEPDVQWADGEDQHGYPYWEQAYSAKAVRAYAAATWAAAMEQAAQICDGQRQHSRDCAEEADRQFMKDIYHHAAVTAHWCAAAIRMHALSPGQVGALPAPGETPHG